MQYNNSMIQTNSSRCYPPIFATDGSLLTSVHLHIQGQHIELTSHDFFQLTQLIKVGNSVQMKSLGLYDLIYNEKNFCMSHIFLYYCIKTELKISIEGLQSFYLKHLGNIYVESQFNIQIGKFAKLCEHFTGLIIHKCAHVIYYLVYGRVATNTYIQLLVSPLVARSERKDKQKIISSQSYILRKGRNASDQENLTVHQINNDNSDQLRQELKQIFETTQLNTKKNIKSLKSRVQYESEMKKMQSQRSGNVDKTDSQKKYYLNFFPNRVFNEEKSAIFERMHPSTRSNYKLMRKKKFNDSKIQKMLFQTFTNGQLEDSRFYHHNKVQLNKSKTNLFTGSLSKANQKFKVVSGELDKIRNTLTKGKKKQSQQQANTTNIGSQNEKQYFQFKQKSDKNQTSASLRCPLKEMGVGQVDAENIITSLIRKQKNNSRASNNSDEFTNERNQKGDNQKLIFRNLENNNENIYGNRMFHSECQNRMFQYKNEYRRFMKVNFFGETDQ